MNNQEDLEDYPLTNNNYKINNETKLCEAKLNVRIGFVRKVYGILCSQLFITVLLCVAAMYSETYFSFMISKAGFGLMIFAAVVSIVISITLICCYSFVNKVPTNYCLLFAFTFCEGYLISYTCALTDRKLVLMAAAMTLAITLALTVYAMTTKEDFTYLGASLFIAGTVFCLFGFFLFFTNNNVVHIIFSCFGVILYGIYLIYDTQLIMGGKHTELGVDAYIIGALIIYIDIITIFIYILDLLKRD